MPRTKKDDSFKNPGNIQSMTLEDVMEDRFASYAKDIIQDRALPDARDGLKPAQRRIIYSMYASGNTHSKPTRKSAKTVGDVIGSLHPHGDASVYDAMVRMSQDWKMRFPLIEMQGNNGSIDDDPAAAMRYTEARLEQLSDLLTIDLDKETVQWAPNYDDTIQEPTVLPARFPNLLANGAKGIAEGYSTDIAPHNLNELIEASIKLIKHPNTSLEEIMNIIPGPDFPTGGIVQGRQGIIDAFKTGKGSVVVRSKVEIVKTSKINQLVITEIPYDVVKQDLIKRINKVRFDKEINGIVDVIDETNLEGLKIVVELKNDVDPQLILNYLYKKTNLQTNFNYNMVAIVNRAPKQVGLIELLNAFIEHRRDVILRRSSFDLIKKTDRCHIIEGLKKAVSILDDIIDIIRHSKNKADSKINLMDEFGFSEIQAEAIVTLQLYRLSNTDIVQLEEEYETLLKDIEYLNDVIDNPSSLNKLMIEELKEVDKAYKSNRRTLIEDKVEDIEIDMSQMISHEDVMLTVSKDGYIKRVSLRSYNASSDTITGYKANDEIIGIGQSDTSNLIMGFTDQGNYFALPIFQIDDHKWKDLGEHINKYVKMKNAEKIIDAIIVPEFNSYLWVVLVSANGKMKRTPLYSFQLQRFTRTQTAFKIASTDHVVRAFVVYENDKVIITSKKGYTVIYELDQIPVSGTHSSGVTAMKLEKDDEIAFANVINDKDTEIVFVTEKAQSKRIKVDEFNTFNRPAKGILAAKLNKTNPYITKYVLTGKIDDQIDLIDESINKLQFKDITLMQRESTYTNPLTKNDNFYIVRNIDITQNIDIPNDKEELPSNDDYDLLKMDFGDN